MNARNSLGAAVLWCLLASAAPVAGQSIRYVDDDASTNGTGLDWDHAYRYLQDALFDASGDPTITEIHVAGGTYKPDQDEGGHVTAGDRFATFQMLSGVAVRGGYRGLAGGGDAADRDVALYVSTLSGDLAGNDVADLVHAVPCYSGQDMSYEPGCDAYDLDGDGDVDDADLGIGENSYHVATADDTDTTAVVDGVAITSGNGDYRRGGAMHCENGSLVLTRCTFLANLDGGDGGAMYNSNSSPRLTSCTFIANKSGFNRGGAMCNVNNSHPVLVNCTFVGNIANRGGAIDSEQCSLTLSGCVFRENHSTWSWAGALYNHEVEAHVVNCTFVGNYGRYSGAMQNSYSSTTVIDCLFSGNLATEYQGGAVKDTNGSLAATNCAFVHNQAETKGGALMLWESSGSITNCVLWGNTAGDSGGGVYVGSGDLHLANCILGGNSDSSGAGESAQVDYWSSTVEVDYSCIQGWTGSLGGVGNIGEDPLFVDADGPDDVPGTEDDNLRLSPGSPCIDAGSSLAVPDDWADLDGDGDTTERTPLDLWGLPRFWDDPDTEDTGVADPPDYPAVVDMGTYEYHLPGDLDFDGDVDGNDYWIFAAAIPSCAGDPQYNPAADLDFDGCVTLADYTIWLQLYREANPPLPAPTPGPKPGSPGDMDGSQTDHQPGGGLAR
jgi:hypothetical protein